MENLQSRNENVPTMKPWRMLLMQNSIFVLPGPGRAWEMAKSSWYCGLGFELSFLIFHGSEPYRLFVDPFVLVHEKLMELFGSYEYTQTFFFSIM